MKSVDPSILRALSLPTANTTLHPHGGSGFSSTSRLTSTLADGTTHTYFVKTGQGRDAATMFAGEHASLNAIHDAVPSLCPKSYGSGELESGKGSWLVTQFLEMGGGGSFGGGKGGQASSGMSLAEKLGKLHTTPAPVPEGFNRPMFGFPVPTCCGDTEQDNTFTESWAKFYGQRRLLGILKKSERTNGADKSLRQLVERTVSKVIPRLIGDTHLNKGEGVTPVVVHGDLWSGNKGRGRIDGGEVEDVVFDPSACYAHSEYELGIMKMFGGFGGSFSKEYRGIVEKTEPVGEYEDRVRLYELYHHLNHHVSSLSFLPSWYDDVFPLNFCCCSQRKWRRLLFCVIRHNVWKQAFGSLWEPMY